MGPGCAERGVRPGADGGRGVKPQVGKDSWRELQTVDCALGTQGGGGVSSRSRVPGVLAWPRAALPSHGPGRPAGDPRPCWHLRAVPSAAHPHTQASTVLAYS